MAENLLQYYDSKSQVSQEDKDILVQKVQNMS